MWKKKHTAQDKKEEEITTLNKHYPNNLLAGFIHTRQRQESRDLSPRLTSTMCQWGNRKTKSISPLPTARALLYCTVVTTNEMSCFTVVMTLRVLSMLLVKWVVVLLLLLSCWCLCSIDETSLNQTSNSNRILRHHKKQQQRGDLVPTYVSYTLLHCLTCEVHTAARVGVGRELSQQSRLLSITTMKQSTHSSTILTQNNRSYSVSCS